MTTGLGNIKIIFFITCFNLIFMDLFCQKSLTVSNIVCLGSANDTNIFFLSSESIL